MQKKFLVAVALVVMAHIAGWPGTPGYNVTNHETEKVDGVSPNTVEPTAADINAWKSKRERGDSYGMHAKNDWWKQMDFYESIFVGKTVDEVDAWFKTYASDKTGRPLFAETKDAAEKTKFDAHGNIITALHDAWAKHKPLTK